MRTVALAAVLSYPVALISVTIHNFHCHALYTTICITIYMVLSIQVPLFAALERVTGGSTWGGAPYWRGVVLSRDVERHFERWRRTVSTCISTFVRVLHPINSKCCSL
jgi:cytochrome b subunit of formate dehydrogenase